MTQSTVNYKKTKDKKMKELVEIQAQLRAPKAHRNSFGGYNYRSAEDILEAVKPLLNKTGCALTISDSIIEVGGRIYIQATATLQKGNDRVATTAYAREEEAKKGMDSAQITGSASSYARKYALNGLFAIDDTKDADATNTHGKDSTELTAEQEKELKELAHSVGANIPEMLKFFKVDDFSKLPYEKAKAMLNKKKQKGVEHVA